MTNIPFWFSAGMAAFMAVIVVLFVTRFSGLWRKMRDHPEKMDDDWDPFS
jgi:hypothetical protein